MPAQPNCTTVPVALLHRLGLLPDSWHDSYGVLHEHRQNVVVKGTMRITPDTLAAVCRRLAARYGHEGAAVYWLMHDSEGCWRLMAGGQFGTVVVHSWAPSVYTGRAEALLAILLHPVPTALPG